MADSPSPTKVEPAAVTTRHGLESDPDLPPDFDPDEHPILAHHWFGLELRDGREIFWNYVRLGHRLPADHGVIVIDGGRL
jgi:hypothetical protein